MKKRALAWLLTLALCLGLTVPASAAEASSLDAATAQSYYKVLTEQIQKEGIREKKDGYGVAYAGLEDLNADGKPELIVLGFVMDWCLSINIWTMKNGEAVQTYGDTISIGAYDGRVAFARKNGQIRLFCEYYWQYRMFGGREILLVDGNGNEDRRSTSEDADTAEMEGLTYDKSWIVDSTPILQIKDSLQWTFSDSQTKAVKNMQASLLSQANGPALASGTFGPYTIAGKTDYAEFAVSFSKAKVEKASVQYRVKWVIGDKETPEPYKTVNVTLITIKPDCKITISHPKEEIMGVQTNLTQDGPGKYTYVPAALSVGEDFNMAFLSYDENDLKNELASGPVSIDGGNGNQYIISYETASSDGFTDVKAGAYYEDAVKWAVDKKITSGTTASTFSPNSTCTVGQILTFLWRANGSPAPTIKNPFTDTIPASFQSAAIWAYQKGLVSGKTFGANNPCTRAMAVTYLWKLAGSPTVQNENYKPFTVTYGSSSDTGTLSVPLAFTQKSTLKLCEDHLGASQTSHSVIEEDAVLITVPSGTKVTIHCSENLGDYWSPDTASGKRYYLDQTGVYHSNPGVSSECLSSGDVVEDNVVWRLWLGDTCYHLTTSAASTGFSDVPANSAYAQAVAWAVKQGITSGTTATTFNPNGTCTRGQIVTFLYRAMK